MKFAINRNLKYFVITICSFLLIVITVFLIKYVAKKEVNEKTTTLFRYGQIANVTYKANLNPNIVYDDDFLDEGKIYISEYIDYIDTTFRYKFSGEHKVDIEGEYEIVAILKGTGLMSGVEEVLWEKEYIIKPKTTFSVNSEKYLFEENIPIMINEYNSYAEQVKNESSINSDCVVTYYWNVKLKGETDVGTISEEHSSHISIPLNKKYYKISKSDELEIIDSIDGVEYLKIPHKTSKIIIESGVILLNISIIILLFTKSVTTPTDFHLKKIKKIFKHYGNRLVGVLDTENMNKFEVRLEVKSFDDLLRIADDIGVPIVYEYKSDLKKINDFYLFNQYELYHFKLRKYNHMN